MTEPLVQLDPLSSPRRRAWRNALAATAVVAGAFAVIVAAVMLHRFLQSGQIDPLTANSLIQLKEKLAADPQDEPVRRQLRQIDQDLRHRHFQQQRFLVAGAWMLLAGATASLICARLAATMSTRPYVPPPQVNLDAVSPARARAGILAGGALVAAAIVALAVVSIRQSRTTEEAAVPPPAPLPVPTAEQLARAWLNFRGPGGLGIARAPQGTFPEDWDGPTGHNILWKSPIPLPGHNSPVVYEDSIFLTGADKQKREVYCFDAKTGQLRWTRPVGPKSAPAPKIMDATGYAPNTVACDGQRVYAIFPTGDLACFDLNGHPLWSKALGTPVSEYGFAASLLCWRDRLVLQFDQGGSHEADKSALICFDGQTGKIVWQTPRPVPASWSSPAIITHKDSTQIITTANPWVIAYEPEDGKEIWRVRCLTGDVAPSPAAADGVVFVCQDTADLTAIRADGQGDVTKTHILWRVDPESMPDITSPLATGAAAGDFVFRVTSSGTLVCADAMTGKEAWQQDLESPIHASPILVGKNVYLLNGHGKMYIFESAAEWKQIVTPEPEIDDQTNATPAFAAGRIYIRGKQTLYCVGEEK